MVKLKNNGLSQGDKLDSMTLLDSTDSDVEWLNLPPIKGKKPKRKKTSKPRETGCTCSLWAFLKPVLFITVLGAVVMLIITTIWMTSQISELRAKLDKVESKSLGNIEDIQKLYSQLSLCNKSLEAETKRLSQVHANISTINTTIFKLSSDVAKLEDGMKSAPELKQLPVKLQTVSKTLVDLGSDVTGMKDTVGSLQTSMKETSTKLSEFGTQLNLLKQSTDSDEETGNELSPEMANMMQTLEQKLQDMNGTLSAKASVMMKSLNQHEEKFVRLENMTETLRRDLSALTADHSTISSEHAGMADTYTSDQFKASVTGIVNTVLNQTSHPDTQPGQEATPSPPPPTSSSSLSSLQSSSAVLLSVKDTLNKIQQRYDNISSTVKKNTEDIGDMKENFIPLLRFNTLKEGFQKAMEDLNTTLLNLKAQIDMKQGPTEAPVTPAKVTDKVAEVTEEVPEVSEVTQKVPEVTDKTPAKVTGVTDKLPDKAPEPTEKADTAAPSTKSPSVPEESQSDQPEIKPNKTKPVIHRLSFPDIEDQFDLENKYRMWDRSGSGKIPYEILNEFLGPYTPKRSDLKPFDKDNDDFYTIQEMADALGIDLDEDFLPEKNTDQHIEGREP